MAQCPLPKYAPGAICHWSMTKLKQWWRVHCVFAYHQHGEQKLSTVEFRKLHGFVLGRFLFRR